jgi:hypothetical protein
MSGLFNHTIFNMPQTGATAPEMWFPAKFNRGDGLHAMNLEITPTPAHDLMVQHVYCTIICGAKQLAQLSPIYVLYDSAPYNHSMVQVPYCTVISQRRQDFITQILSRSMYLETGSSYFVAFIFNLIVQSS